MAYSYFRNRDKVPYSVTHDRFLEDDSPIRTALPVSTIPPTRQPPTVPQRPPNQGSASGSSHDATCKVDLRLNI